MNPAIETSVLCAEVAVPLPLKSLFTYWIPEEYAGSLRCGMRVRIPFRNREMVGYVADIKRIQRTSTLKPILGVLDPEPVVSPELMACAKWVSDYYGCSWGEAIENALPKWVKHGKTAQKALANEVRPAPAVREGPQWLTLNEDQERAVQGIQAAFAAPEAKPILLYGVTGSGKSEVYIRAIHATLAQGRSAICLVPEIALTEQLRLFFHQHFGDSLEVLHSKLTDTERFLAWKRIQRGDRRVVLGPRSAVFAPVVKLGLLILDEEHEGSYKQETVPRYHAREVARWRAQNEKAVFVMGSATPSIEIMRLAEQGAVTKMDLLRRIRDKALPEVRIVDMRQLAIERKKRHILSPHLAAEIEKNLQNKESTLLLLNRRGFFTHIFNAHSGETEQCPSCHVSLTYHQEENILLCHYCNFRRAVPDTSPDGAPLLRFSGFGTERIESELAQRWPHARIARLDADSARERGAHERILRDFRDHKLDILVGTQMIAKGFDFPHVTLVGVVLADVGLMLPDFRSAERTFQLLTQVAGRAGRGELPGRVVIQTYSPHHPSVAFSKEHDYLSFYRFEKQSRYEHHYPPFRRLINFIIRSKEENKAYLYAREWREILRAEISKGFVLEEGSPNGVKIIGPSPLPFYKLRGHFRWHVMVKFGVEKDLMPVIADCLAKIKKNSKVVMSLDVDPYNIL
ncbi:MAG: replication restart helicase PriA [Candidatus Omnitrophota bacterium]